MLSIVQLEGRFSTIYSDSITSYTQRKRRTNIEIFNTMIENDIDNNELKYNETEYRVKVYETKKNESIYIQYPGLISSRNTKPFKMDYKPIIVNASGEECVNATFQKLWDVFEAIVERHKELLSVLSLLFFRMGRMIKYDYTAVDEGNIMLVKSVNSITDTHNSRPFKIYKLLLEDDEIEALNYNAGSVEFQNGFRVSFEAFLYFFEMILQIEDCKYYIFNDGSLKSGRVSSSDSMLLLASYYNKKITISEMLQKFINGQGVGKCRKTEYINAIGENVTFVNQKEYVLNRLNDRGIECKTTTKTIDGVKLKCKIFILDKKIAFYEDAPDNNIIDALNDNGWRYILLNKEFEDKTIDNTINEI